MQTCYSILLPGDIDDDAAAAVCRRHNRVAAKLECILIQAKNYYCFVYDMCCPAAAAAVAAIKKHRRLYISLLLL